jgi:uncharacterized repeat protein (TIGR02543 family)
MRKRLVLVVALLVLLGMFGCGKKDDTPETVTYTVSFLTYEGSAVASVNVDEGNSIVLTDYVTSKDGHEFQGWSLTQSGNVLQGAYTPTSNVTLHAIFTQLPETYQISFADEDGNVIITKEVTEGQIPSHNYVVTDTQEWDYTFDGWTSTLGGETILDPLPVATEDATYYASVSQSKQQYTITFVSNGGTSVQAMTLEFGLSATEPDEPTKEGFSFVSWTTDVALSVPAEWPMEVTGDITLYAAWNESIDLGVYLTALLSSYGTNPYTMIPQTMHAGGRPVMQDDPVMDYSSDVNVSTILSGGYGEQWQMVLANVEQTKVFFDLLTIVDGLSTASVVAFNNYLDSNPTDENAFEFMEGIYSISIFFEDNVMSYVVDYTADLPGFGIQTIQLALAYNIDTLEKVGRIQIGDANALKYVSTEDSFTFAIRYLGVRRAYFDIIRHDDETVTGSIFEFLGVDNVFSTLSAAQFLITDDHVSVVGNKAGSMIGFTGTINELYDSDNGKLLGYSVRETLSVVTYNTMWISLEDQVGIQSIREVMEVNGSNPSTIYVNQSATVFASKLVGGFSLKNSSRRYDIEFRTQYFYYYSSEDEAYISVAVRVPMLFVQHEQIGQLDADVVERNSYLPSFSMTMAQGTQDKILDDYNTLIDIFIENKENVTEDDVLDFIGSKIVYS